MESRLIKRWIAYTAVFAIVMTVLSFYFYWVAYTIIVGVGLVISWTFLVLHRPSKWKTVSALDASGWIIIIFLLYLRASLQFALAVFQDRLLYPGTEQHIVMLLFGIPLNSFLLLRLMHWIKFYHEAKDKEESRSLTENT